jgi:hypothetical protein
MRKEDGKMKVKVELNHADYDITYLNVNTDNYLDINAAELKILEDGTVSLTGDLNDFLSLQNEIAGIIEQLKSYNK